MIYKLSCFDETDADRGQVLSMAQRPADDPKPSSSHLADRVIAGFSDCNADTIASESLQLSENLMSKLRSEQFSNISHEFKTPINIILSSMDLLKLKLRSDNALDFEKNYAKYIHYIEQNCYKLLRLVGNLLDSTKMEQQNLTLMTSQCELKSFLQNTLTSAGTFASKCDIELHFRCDEGGPVYLNCDRDRVDRILLNLLSNAIKHMPRGGNIFVTLRQDPDFVYITVTDEGEGIAPEFLPHIFDRFQTCSKSFLTGDEGAGLGLFIVKGLVTMHHGVIQAESTVGKGSTFTFSLSRHLPHSMSVPASFLSEEEAAKLRSMTATELGVLSAAADSTRGS